MSHAAAIAPSLRDHLAGPPGSGKTAALADRIAAAIRGGANSHVLLVVAPSRVGAGALAERVRRLCGSTRTKRYRFCSLDDFLRRAAAQHTHSHHIFYTCQSAWGRYGARIRCYHAFHPALTICIYFLGLYCAIIL